LSLAKTRVKRKYLASSAYPWSNLRRRERLIFLSRSLYLERAGCKTRQRSLSVVYYW